MFLRLTSAEMIGASMNLSHLYKAGTLTWESSLWRLCVAPLVGVLKNNLADPSLKMVFDENGIDLKKWKDITLTSPSQ